MAMADKKPIICGGITEVDLNKNGLEMDGHARFAVDEHNKKENTLLEFQKVVSAKQQVVEGMLYYITLEATDGGHKKVYEAKIWERLWLNFKELQEFKLIAGSPSDSSA